MTRDEREKIIWRHLLTGTLSQEEAVRVIAELWHNDVLSAEEEGYDKAAHDITVKLQDRIPDHYRTVEEARIMGAWTDAASIALHHIGHYPNRKLS